MGIGAGVFARRQCNVELIAQRWPAGRGDSAWTGVFADVIQDLPYGRRIEDERNDPHLPSAVQTHQWEHWNTS